LLSGLKSNERTLRNREAICSLSPRRSSLAASKDAAGDIGPRGKTVHTVAAYALGA
jgi:hypothetical protein